MPKSADQKLKLILLLQYFNENTDRQHPISMAEIITYLEANGIHAERKSIYTDIEALNRLGYDVVFKKERPSGYYMESRDFELAELKLLVDAVQSSKFITEKKSNALIKKIEKLTSKHEGRKLQRQVYVANRVKTDNEAVLYNIDYIHEAIANNKKIHFKYCEWNTKKQLVERNNGKEYIVSPISLIWDDEYYYLAAFDTEADKIKHYRVDKIRGIFVGDETRDKIQETKEFNSADYAKQHFGMFSGDEDIVTIRFENGLIGAIIDRFGKGVTIIPRGNGYSSARIKLQVSDRFFGWLVGFHGGVTIDAPKEVQEKYIKLIEDIRQGF